MGSSCAAKAITTLGATAASWLLTVPFMTVECWSEGLLRVTIQKTLHPRRHPGILSLAMFLPYTAAMVTCFSSFLLHQLLVLCSFRPPLHRLGVGLHTTKSRGSFACTVRALCWIPW